MMNLKYYLRGLGIGIIVTALIMGFGTSGRKETLSSEEIKERAKALGMTEERTVLSDTITGQQMNSEGEGDLEEPEAAATSTPTSQPVATPTPSATEEPVATPTPSATEEPIATPSPDKTVEPTKEPTPSATIEPAAVPTAEPTAVPKGKPVEAEGAVQSSEKISIQVNSGDGSLTVCKKLEEAGLVASASEFDSYLYQNGYDKRLGTGTFEIPANADQEQIARILARME